MLSTAELHLRLDSVMSKVESVGFKIGFKDLFELSALIKRVNERTELGEFLVEVVAQLRIPDSKQFDRRVTVEDQLEALRETGRGEVVCQSYTKCQERKQSDC